MPEKHGYVVVDPASGRTLVADNQDARFRTASVVKPLIAYDFAGRFMTERGPSEFDAAAVPDFFREKLSIMLRSSDDKAVDAFWDEPKHYPDAEPASMWPNNGNIQVVSRMAKRMNLENTVSRRDRPTPGRHAAHRDAEAQHLDSGRPSASGDRAHPTRSAH